MNFKLFWIDFGRSHTLLWHCLSIIDLHFFIAWTRFGFFLLFCLLPDLPYTLLRINNGSYVVILRWQLQSINFPDFRETVLRVLDSHTWHHLWTWRLRRFTLWKITARSWICKFKHYENSMRWSSRLTIDNRQEDSINLLRGEENFMQTQF